MCRCWQLPKGLCRQHVRCGQAGGTNPAAQVVFEGRHIFRDSDRHAGHLNRTC
jgi:hypothetical protein